MSAGEDSIVHYEPANSFEIPRFSGVRTFMRLPNNQDLQNANAAIVGTPFDADASFRAGARFGLKGIRGASHLLAPGSSIQVRMRGSLYELGNLEASREELGFDLIMSIRNETVLLRGSVSFVATVGRLLGSDNRARGSAPP